MDEYSRKFKVEKRDLVLNGKAVWLIGREKVPSGPEKGKLVPAVIRKLEFDMITKVSLSPRQDDVVIIEVRGEHASVLDIPLKTEFITQLVKKIKEKTKRDLNLEFTDEYVQMIDHMHIIFILMIFRVNYISKKGRLGGDKRKINWLQGEGDQMVMKVSGIINKDAIISIGRGLPNTSSIVTYISYISIKIQKFIIRQTLLFFFTHFSSKVL